MAATQPLQPFAASYSFSFQALDIGCAGKQNRLLEAAEELGFVLEECAFGEPSVVKTALHVPAPSAAGRSK